MARCRPGPAFMAGRSSRRGCHPRSWADRPRSPAIPHRPRLAVRMPAETPQPMKSRCVSLVGRGNNLKECFTRIYSAGHLHLHHGVFRWAANQPSSSSRSTSDCAARLNGASEIRRRMSAFEGLERSRQGIDDRQSPHRAHRPSRRNSRGSTISHRVPLFRTNAGQCAYATPRRAKERAPTSPGGVSLALQTSRPAGACGGLGHGRTVNQRSRDALPPMVYVSPAMSARANATTARRLRRSNIAKSIHRPTCSHEPSRKARDLFQGRSLHPETR